MHAFEQRALAAILTAILVLAVYGVLLAWWETRYGGDAPKIRFFARRLGHDCYLAETYYPYQPAVWCRVAP